MVDLGHIQSSLVHEVSTIAIGSFLSCCMWFLANWAGYSYGVTSMVVVGATLMFTVIYDNQKFGSNPGTKTCTYECICCLIIFFGLCFYMGTSTFTSGPSAPSSFTGIIYSSVGMASVIACSRAVYFGMLIASRLELPEL